MLDRTAFGRIAWAGRRELGGLLLLEALVFLTMLRWRTPAFCSNVAAGGWDRIALVVAPIVETLVLFAAVLAARAILRVLGLGFALGYALVSYVATQQHLHQGVPAALVAAVTFFLQTSIILRTVDNERWFHVIAFVAVLHSLSNILSLAIAKAAAALTC